jgi:hypothetical protein
VIQVTAPEVVKALKWLCESGHLRWDREDKVYLAGDIGQVILLSGVFTCGRDSLGSTSRCELAYRF